MNKTCDALPPVNHARDVHENAGALTFMNMQTPTITQIQFAIEILTKLGERLNVQAAHSIAQLPETPLGAHYAGNIGSQTIEQINRIENVTMQLKIWADELVEQKRSTMARPKARTRIHEIIGKCMVLENKYVAASRMGSLQPSTTG